MTTEEKHPDKNIYIGLGTPSAIHGISTDSPAL